MNDLVTPVSRLRDLIRSSAPNRRGSSLEAMSVATGIVDAPARDDVLHQVEQTLRRMPPDEIGDPQEFRRALEILLSRTDRSLSKLKRAPDTPLDRQDMMAFEAVIRTDGTRPSLLVREGKVDPHHPLAGNWTGTLADTQDRLRPCIQAVGRIEPRNATARNYFGTGWVVDAGKGLVLTNLHVLEAMWRRLSNAMLRTEDGSFRILGDSAYIDFVGESGIDAANRFRIVKATPSPIDGDGFGRLDAAVLTIEPTKPGQTIPSAIPVVADIDGPKGNRDSFCIVGFPGAPPYQNGIEEGVDWAWVNTTLFGGRYGVKRLAPGVVHHPLGSFDNDKKGWVFGHDATTLGGSSGSPLLAWRDDASAFGLHFAGASVDTNTAHAIARCRETLLELGVPVQPG